MLDLFSEWRAFEQPPLRDGAPDYTAETIASRYEDFKNLREQLHGLDTTG